MPNSSNNEEFRLTPRFNDATLNSGDFTVKFMKVLLAKNNYITWLSRNENHYKLIIWHFIKNYLADKERVRYSKKLFPNSIFIEENFISISGKPNDSLSNFLYGENYVDFSIYNPVVPPNDDPIRIGYRNTSQEGLLHLQASVEACAEDLILYLSDRDVLQKINNEPLLNICKLINQIKDVLIYSEIGKKYISECQVANETINIKELPIFHYSRIKDFLDLINDSPDSLSLFEDTSEAIINILDSIPIETIKRTISEETIMHTLIPQKLILMMKVSGYIDQDTYIEWTSITETMNLKKIKLYTQKIIEFEPSNSSIEFQKPLSLLHKIRIIASLLNLYVSSLENNNNEPLKNWGYLTIKVLDFSNTVSEAFKGIKNKYKDFDDIDFKEKIELTDFFKVGSLANDSISTFIYIQEAVKAYENSTSKLMFAKILQAGSTAGQFVQGIIGFIVPKAPFALNTALSFIIIVTSFIGWVLENSIYKTDSWFNYNYFGNGNNSIGAEWNDPRKEWFKFKSEDGKKSNFKFQIARFLSFLFQLNASISFNYFTSESSGSLKKYFRKELILQFNKPFILYKEGQYKKILINIRLYGYDVGTKMVAEFNNLEFILGNEVVVTKPIDNFDFIVEELKEFLYDFKYSIEITYSPFMEGYEFYIPQKIQIRIIDYLQNDDSWRNKWLTVLNYAEIEVIILDSESDSGNVSNTIIELVPII